MKLPVSLLVVVLLIHVVIAADDVTFEELTSFITNQPSSAATLVTFHSTSCRFCIQWMPEIPDLEAMLLNSEQTEKVIVLSVNVKKPANKPAINQFRLTGVPSVLLFHDGRIDKFSGHRSAKTVSEWTRDLLSGSTERASAESIGL
ncbi:Thioredoxin [Carpediemonas membranifera]|uniref:Thioredoxin n=1 Tax=Carpediemonas membranifera TaxID=201153 RepID=A0A8J6AVX7_9EUKA|nr:Thioredoxin [Carpediemonas membranifera]|eukprot:KAG9389568.1 Thioredoxin [Carpediemonas membranifera]